MATSGDSKNETEPASSAELRAKIEVLTEENARLKDSYTRAKQTQYRRSAFGLAIIGILSIGGALAIPSAQSILFALGGIGLIGGILTYYLTPETFISADVGRSIYTVLADNESELVAELGLSEERIYVPMSSSDATTRLFVPHESATSLPSQSELKQTLVIGGNTQPYGLSVTPTGTPLFDTFRETVTDSIASTPRAVTEQLLDALVTQFELLQSASVDSMGDDDQLTVACSGSVYGPIDSFDHPVVSTIGIGLAHVTSNPVAVDVFTSDDSSGNILITFSWNNTFSGSEK